MEGNGVIRLRLLPGAHTPGPPPRRCALLLLLLSQSSRPCNPVQKRATQSAQGMSQAAKVQDSQACITQQLL
jgi:hypothetical protein